MTRLTSVLPMLFVLSGAGMAMAQTQQTMLQQIGPSGPVASRSSSKIVPAAITIPPVPRPNDPPKPKQPGVRRS